MTPYQRAAKKRYEEQMHADGLGDYQLSGRSLALISLIFVVAFGIFVKWVL